MDKNNKKDEPEDITLSGISQEEKDKYWMATLTCEI